MRWKPELANGTDVPAQVDESLALRDRLSADLQDRDVPASAADRLAERILPQLEGKSRPEQEATLDGIALGFCTQSTLDEELARSAGELQEIERLMGSFAGELSKLDEVLEVLAAYLRRLRTAAPAPSSRILH